MKRKQKQKPVIEHGLPIYAHGSDEANAVRVLHDIVDRTRAFFVIFRRSDGVTFIKPMTPRLTALCQAPQPSEWVILTREQAGAWEGFLGKVFDGGQVRQRLREGSRAPWPWPPSVEGKIYTAETGPPVAEMSDQEAADFK